MKPDFTDSIGALCRPRRGTNPSDSLSDRVRLKLQAPTQPPPGCNLLVGRGKGLPMFTDSDKNGAAISFSMAACPDGPAPIKAMLG